VRVNSGFFGANFGGPKSASRFVDWFTSRAGEKCVIIRASVLRFRRCLRAAHAVKAAIADPREWPRYERSADLNE
jgi:hypothetical protein